jgi:hypothetical protein
LQPAHRTCRCKMQEIPEIFDLVGDSMEESSVQQGITGNPDYELGETVPRAVLLDTSPPKDDVLSLQISGAPAILHADVEMQEAEDAISFEVTPPIIRSVQRDKIAPVTSFGGDEPTRTVLPRKRKKTQPLDEIDSIFG